MQHLWEHKEKIVCIKHEFAGKAAKIETVKRLLLLISGWSGVMFTASWRIFLIYLLSLLHANNKLQILVTSRYLMSHYDSIHNSFSLSPSFLIFFSTALKWKILIRPLPNMDHRDKEHHHRHFYIPHKTIFLHFNNS